MPIINQGIAQFEAIVKEGGNQDMVRDVAASELRRAQIELMRGNTAAALADIRRAREGTARLAKRDPQNKMLLSDMCDFDFEEGRVLTVTGKAAQGVTLSQRSTQCFVELHLEADTGPGMGLLNAWIAEGQVQLHNLPEALKHFQTAADSLTPDVEKYDDARCDLAMVESKIGNTVLQMGKLDDALAHFRKALAIANLQFSLEHMDPPALYAAADAYAGLGDVATAKARKAKDAATQAMLREDARKAYTSSLSVWKQIPNPSWISGAGYRVGDPKTIARRLDALGHS
jgi:tetratricopeptide (TPR) repeat protein